MNEPTAPAEQAHTFFSLAKVVSFTFFFFFTFSFFLYALVGMHWLIIHVELEVSAPFECGAMRRASGVVHREVVHTLGSDSLCGTSTKVYRLRFR